MADWLKRDLDILARDYPAGVDIDLICRALNFRFSRDQIRRRANRLGLERPGQWSAKRDAELIRRYKAGEATTTIGRHLSPAASTTAVLRRIETLIETGRLSRRKSATLAQLAASVAPAAFISAAAEMRPTTDLAEQRAQIVGLARGFQITQKLVVEALRDLADEIDARRAAAAHDFAASPPAEISAVVASCRMNGDRICRVEGRGGRAPRFWVNWREASLIELVRRANTFRRAQRLGLFDERAFADFERAGYVRAAAE